MAGFLSTLRGSCRALFKSFTSTLSTLKKWFQRDIAPTIQEIASSIRQWYQRYVRPFASQAFQFVSDHPVAIAIGVFGIIVFACSWVITTPLLYLLGFMILGPAVGSLAAFTQSIIGNLSAGSIFTILQSAGMAGSGLMALNGIVVTVAALILLVVIVRLSMVQRMDREKRKEGEKNGEKERNKVL
ncbi:hypothetical protein OCU04_010850 [Sclerotinia nivalis]|uniref:Uncharacterized protein n=1 Tax=Sclerotinia nivalis TaxID=352851 RepID=A0A9X0AE60_9HELO|nr:hypothetical protein OCU04_010850 [Sclerotinia nivalis]